MFIFRYPCAKSYIAHYMLVIDAQRQIFQLAVDTTVRCFFSVCLSDFTYLAIDIYLAWSRLIQIRVMQKKWIKLWNPWAKRHAFRSAYCGRLIYTLLLIWSSNVSKFFQQQQQAKFAWSFLCTKMGRDGIFRIFSILWSLFNPQMKTVKTMSNRPHATFYKLSWILSKQRHAQINMDTMQCDAGRSLRRKPQTIESNAMASESLPNEINFCMKRMKLLKIH